LCLFKAKVLEHAASAKLAMQTSVETGVQTTVQTHVRLLRVRRDAKTSIVVQVLGSNTVLKCEVTDSSTQHLRQGQTVTIQSLIYDPPFLRVSIQNESRNESQNESQKESENENVQNAVDVSSTQQRRLRKRMCFDDL